MNPAYRRRFTGLTDWLVSPDDLGFYISTWGLNGLGGCKRDAFRRRGIERAKLRAEERVLGAYRLPNRR